MRTRITEGAVAPESANRAWKSASKVATIQPSLRLRSSILASLALARPASPACTDGIPCSKDARLLSAAVLGRGAASFLDWQR